MSLLKVTFWLVVLVGLAVYLSGKYIDVSRYHLKLTIEQVNGGQHE